MTTFHQTWNLVPLDFQLAQSNLFDVPVEAIVNSEQSDFILSQRDSSISGQIWHRYGPENRLELAKLTGGRILPAGTVLNTSCSRDYKYIYHAGFHHPKIWLDANDDENQTTHIHLIRGCIREILCSLDDDGVSSVAFPLIGCGLFGLDPLILAYQFMDEILSTVSLPIFRSRKEIWLVVPEEQIMSIVLGAVVQAVIDRNNAAVNYEPLSLGVAYMDDFEIQLLHSGHPQWSAWLTTRYCELLTGFIFSVLAGTVMPSVRPEDIMEPDSPASFGLIRDSARDIAKKIISRDVPLSWSEFLAQLIQHDIKHRRLERINCDRNDIAHGRTFRDVREIRQDLIDFLSLPEWKNIVSRLGHPRTEDLDPWVVKRDYLSSNTLGGHLGGQA